MGAKSNSIHIHLWIFNHKFTHIIDFTESLIARFRQNGYRVTLGRRPNGDALNVVLESFNTESRGEIKEFYRATGKRVAVVMTEDLEFIENRVLMHQKPIWEDDGYMHPGTKVRRVVNLVALTPYIELFITFRTMIDLSSLAIVFEETPVCYLPYPEVAHMLGGAPVAHDLVFSGSGTAYRNTFLRQLERQGIGVYHPKRWISRNRMHALYRGSKIVLSLPQSKTWNGFLSIMRFLSALRAGKPLLLLFEKTESPAIPSVPVQKLDINLPSFRDEMMARLADWEGLYQRTFEQYHDVVAEGIRRDGLSHEYFAEWQATEA